MRIISVVGARPQFVKLAPISQALALTNHVHEVIHTGQHYDPAMSDIFFEELQIPPAEWNLGIGSKSHGAQTGAMLEGIEAILVEHRPDWLLVYGDTNSTLAASLAAVKLGIRVAHLEAGLRSFNRSMPEEHNRVLTDHAADLLLAPTQVAASHLQNEGLADRTRIVGDVMVDVLLRVAEQVRGRQLRPDFHDAPGDFILATIHRPENTDDPERLSAVVSALAAIELPVYLAVHPRLSAAANRFSIALDAGSIIPIPPLSYGEVVSAALAARSVVTDSGGLQKEAFVLGTPVTTVRSETEWVETLVDGWNVLPTDLMEVPQLALRERPANDRGEPYGPGDSAERVVAEMSNF